MGYIDKNKQREHQRLWMHSRRLQWIEDQGGCCILCGSAESLEVDHVDPAKKSMNPSQVWSRKDRHRELAKCQVLCRVCHKKKTADYMFKNAPHGTENMHRKYKCRCDLCKAWKRRKSNAEYQRRKRMAAQRVSR